MYQTRIEKLVNGGDGFGRWQEKAVFLPNTAPGDLVNFRPIKEKKRHIVGEVVEVVEPSPLRCQPRCPYFGDCGGCSWQFLPYQEQASWKERIFAETLSFKTGVDAEIFSPIIQADPAWNYRSRVQLRCRKSRDGVALGFYRRGSHHVVDIDHCPVMPNELNESLPAIRQMLESIDEQNPVTQIDLSIDDFGRKRVLIHLASHVPDHRLAELKQLFLLLAREIECSAFIQAGKRSAIEHLAGDDELHVLPEGAGGAVLGYGAGGFAQIHLEQNRALVERVVALADLQGDEQVLDLYCGMGNFSLPLAKRAASVVGVEDSKQSIDWAKRNAAANKIVTATFVSGRVEDWLTAEHLAGVDMVLLDPPRSGAHDAVKILAEGLVPKIIYVSCDPATLARDLAVLVEGGYHIVSAAATDLFPQTAHIEGIVMLELDG